MSKLKTKEEIKIWLDFMGIKNYTINNDLTVDVNGDVNLFDKNLKEIPLRFGIVKGKFYCNNNLLLSLEGSPKECKELYCHDNNGLTYEYLDRHDFSFVKDKVYTDSDIIDNKWNKKPLYPEYISNYFVGV